VSPRGSNRLTTPSEPAIAFLDPRHPKCAAILRAIKPTEATELLIGSTKEGGTVRVQFGEPVSTVLDKTSKEQNEGQGDGDRHRSRGVDRFERDPQKAPRVSPVSTWLGPC
jgi:hypothetical protein